MTGPSHPRRHDAHDGTTRTSQLSFDAAGIRTGRARRFTLIAVLISLTCPALSLP